MAKLSSHGLTWPHFVKAWNLWFSRRGSLGFFLDEREIPGNLLMIRNPHASKTSRLMPEEHTRSLELVPQLTRRKAPCQARSFAKEIPFIDLFAPAKAAMTAASEREHTP